MCVACDRRMVNFMQALVSRRSLLAGATAMAAAGAMNASVFATETLAAPQGSSDLILVNGDFATMNPRAPRAEAMAVSGGRITAIGRHSDIRRRGGRAAQVVDLGGKTVMPGFIDAHMHFTPVILGDFIDASADKIPTVAALQAALREEARMAGSGGWVRARNYDPSIMRERRAPTLAELDASVPDQPVFVLESNGHVGYANSAAFKLAGVDASTPDPATARFVRDNGQLTGRIEEMPAFLPFIAKMPVVPESEMANRCMNLAKDAAAAGCTMVHDCGIGTAAGPLELARLQKIAKEGSPVRIRGMLVSTLADEWAQMGLRPGFGDDICRIWGVKAWSDGSNQARTGLMREPYLGVSTRGSANYTPEELVAAIRRAHGEGWQVGVHANGDAGIDMTIDAYRKVLGDQPMADHRHRIEHCSLLHPEQIVDMVELGLSPSFLIEHVYIWGTAFQQRILGPERVMFYDPCKSAVDAGLKISLHSDYDVTPIRPLQKVETAVTRIMRESGDVLNPAERLTREQAFKAVTIDAAWQLKEDHNAGSLEAGKFADFVVLGANPFKVPADQIGKVPVIETWLGGVKQG